MVRWEQKQQEQEEEQKKKKKEEEQTPKKQYQSLNYDQALLQFRFISSNDDNNSSSGSMKGNETPRIKKPLSFSPSPISSPLLQRMKHKSWNSSMKNLPITPDDVCVTLRFPLNINHPYMNAQGALPFQIPSCSRTRIINGQTKIIGYHDKLCLHLPCWDIIGSFETYKAWLPPDGSGFFVMMPRL